jgi:hypothetical protein
MAIDVVSIRSRSLNRAWSTLRRPCSRGTEPRNERTVAARREALGQARTPTRTVRQAVEQNPTLGAMAGRNQARSRRPDRRFGVWAAASKRAQASS